MIVAGQRLPIVIATKPVDFRRGHDGLAATVQNELGLSMRLWRYGQDRRGGCISPWHQQCWPLCSEADFVF